ncbi:calcyphosin-2 isoform X4 [Rhineura floridana]|uniref:calcyphosin-2 isoform X4 n=1 Tax=Rhineura floridana TaxID=261503 RepID=UPI002AC8468B|nr:calcyphosin-2 isoform X4 [Rhineura floridana]
MDLEVKGVAASPRKHVPLSSKKNKLAQGWRTHTKSNHGPRPAEVPCLDLGKLGDSEDEDGDTYIPYSAGEPHTDPLQSSSTISWGTPVQNPSAQHYDIQQLSLWEQKTVPENLPPPADSYKLKYQQYEAEMKEGYKEYSQRAEEKKAKNSQPHKTPGKIIEEQPKNKTDDELTVLDEKALLQQCYASKPYTTQHNIRKLEAEDLATERKKQAVVEQVMIDQLSRAVISDPEQNMRTDTCEKDLMFPGLRTAPLRFRKRTLHETKIRTRSALTENMLSNKLRFDGRLISRTKALPFIQKGIYSHQRGQRKGKQYCLNDVYIGADLTFLTLHHPGLPESIKQKPLFTIRVTNIDETAKAFLKTFDVENEKHALRQEDDGKNIFRNIQDMLREKLSKRGVRTVTGLGKYFREMEEKQNGILTKADFKEALKMFHLEVSEKDFEALWLILDDNSDDEVDYIEFTHAILGEMNEYRKAFVRKAYMKLDYNKTGSVPMIDIKKCYCAKKHPQVLADNATEEEIKSSFLETLEDACRNPNEVSFCEFEDYYEGLSIGILDDEDFVNTLRNPWGI